MDVVLHRSLAEIHLRVDALGAGRVRQPRWLDRARALFPAAGEPVQLAVLAALDRDLDRAGVHTSADARLLRELGVRTGRAASVARGIESRAQRAIEELEAAVRRAERALLAGRVPAGTIAMLERGLVQATRAVKVADTFAASNASEALEIFPRPPLRSADGAPKSPAVAIAEVWAERAVGRFDDVVQRRRELDAAHELLLRIAGDVDRDRDRLRLLRLEVSAARERVKEEPPFRSLAEVLRHIRRTSEHDPMTAYRAAHGLYTRSVEAGRADVAGPALALLRAFASDSDRVREAIESGARTTPMSPAEPSAPSKVAAAAERADLAHIALALGDDALEQFDLAEACARLFAIDGVPDAPSGAGVAAQFPRAPAAPRRVMWPTERLTFDFASGLHEARDFVIQDPRRVLYDLASGRQLVRAWLEDAPEPERAPVRKTAVRLYVCDASGSMQGTRARFRNALLLAELNQLRRRAARGEAFDPLYFCYFNERPSELKRVAGADESSREMACLLIESPAQGQTDITRALEHAFESIRSARGADPYLARATVVLVTDGEDRVDAARIRAARSPIDGVRIALSFIALGQENRDLKAIAREQREEGERAFYTHLTDRDILLTRTEFDSLHRTLLPADLPVGPVELERLQPHLEALDALAHALPVPELVPLSSFDALFPPITGERGRPAPSRTAHELVGDILGAIAEAAPLAPVDDRPSEAVRLLHHLLRLYQLTVPAYLEHLAQPSDAVVRALARIRRICAPF